MIAALSAVLACARPAPSLGPLYVESHSRDRKGERFTQAFDGDRLVVDVESELGIGRATFRPGRGVWPARLAFRMHLKGLEGFEARGAKKFETSVAEKPLSVPPVVEVPRDVYEGAAELEIRWVDFYR